VKSYLLTVDWRVSDWLDSLIGAVGVALSSVLRLICSTNFSFMGGVGKRQVTKNLDVRNIFAGPHTEHPH
jgi:hypothetical protein